MQNEGEIYFGLFGDDFDPELLFIGVTPTRTERKGKPIPKHSSWIYSTGKIVDEIVDVYKMSSLIVNKLEPHIERILEAKKEYNLEAVLEVVLTITSEDSISTPVIGFDSSVIAFLDKVGATIDIDTYISES